MGAADRRLYWTNAGGGLGLAATPMPTLTEAWQHVSVDVTVPADAASGAALRLYNGSATQGTEVYYDDLSVREVWGPLGPQWRLAPPIPPPTPPTPTSASPSPTSPRCT